MLAPIEIAPDTYWVGQREPNNVFFANPYLRLFKGQDPKSGKPVQLSMLIDPGSSSDFSTVRSKVESLIGNLDRLSAIFINHQDPDVCSVTPMLTGRLAPKAMMITSEDTWRLIVHMHLPRERFIATEKYTHNGLKLATGHKVYPVPSPYCHFAGAVMLYDPEKRVLITGDLFGGLTDANAKGTWADETDWVGMRAFHQLYMPANHAIASAIETIRRLDPPVEIIAPQHGRVIKGPLVKEYMDRLSRLQVGVDILDDRKADPSTLEAWTTVLRRVVKRAAQVLGPTAEVRLADDPELQETLEFTVDGITIKSLGKWSVEQAVRVLTIGEPASIANPLKYEAVTAANDLQLITPNVSIEQEDDVYSDMQLLQG